MAQNTKYKAFLESQKVSQKTVSEQTKITKSMICTIANGYSDMNTRTLKKLVIFHECSPNDILDWEKWIRDAKLKK